MKQTARIEIITPAIARKMLLQNTLNRPPSMHRVSIYARDMANGDWQLNASHIRFADNGRLLDGQTRLMACIKADVPFETWVTRGLPPHFVHTMDLGKFRSVADQHAFDGEKSTSALGAVINLIAEIFGGRCQRLNYAEQREVLDDNPDIRDCVKSKRLRFLKVPASVEHAAFFLSTRAYGIDWTSDWFFRLSQSQFDSAQAAFDLFMKKRVALSRNEEYIGLAAILVKTIKWSKSGRKLALVWNPDKEAFPQL